MSMYFCIVKLDQRSQQSSCKGMHAIYIVAWNAGYLTRNRNAKVRTLTT
jgi:hypothetical protein